MDIVDVFQLSGRHCHGTAAMALALLAILVSAWSGHASTDHESSHGFLWSAQGVEGATFDLSVAEALTSPSILDASGMKMSVSAGMSDMGGSATIDQLYSWKGDDLGSQTRLDSSFSGSNAVFPAIDLQMQEVKFETDGGSDLLGIGYGVDSQASMGLTPAQYALPEGTVSTFGDFQCSETLEGDGAGSGDPGVLEFGPPSQPLSTVQETPKFLVGVMNSLDFVADPVENSPPADILDFDLNIYMTEADDDVLGAGYDYSSYVAANDVKFRSEMDFERFS